MTPRKTTIAILATLFASLGLADDFKTLSGKEYKDATVSRIEPDGIVVKTKSGLSKLCFTELPNEVHFGNHRRQSEQKPDLVGGAFEPSVLMGEQSGLPTRSATTESATLCAPMKS